MPKITTFDLFESSFSHSEELNNLPDKSIWVKTSNNECFLNPHIQRKLIRTAENFWNKISPVFGGKEIYDIQITGDSAEPLYASPLDIDLHIIIDTDGLEEEEYRKLSSFFEKIKFQSNMENPLKVRGFDLNLFVNKRDNEHSGSGLFSLLKNKWLKNPEIGEAYDSRDVEKKYLSLITAIETISSKLESPSCPDEMRKKLLEEAIRIKRKIQHMMASGQDESKPNPVVKKTYEKLKKEGYINRLIRILP